MTEKPKYPPEEIIAGVLAAYCWLVILFWWVTGTL